MKILVVDGSQRPPTFVGNLIDVLLRSGLDVSLYGQEALKPYTSDSPRFSRVVTQYKRFNAARLLLKLVQSGFTSPRIVMESWKLTASIPEFKVRIKTFSRYVLLLAFKPDIIHLQWPLHLTEFEPLIGTGKIKFIVSLRGKQITVDPQVKPDVANYFRRWFPKMDGFHAVSRATGAHAVALGASAEQVRVIYSGVPDSFLQSFNINDRYSQTPLNILSVGRVHWQKGYTDALDAMKILAGQGVQFHYTIVAPGPVPDEILHYIYSQDLNDQVSVVGEIAYNRMIPEMKKFSVLLLPSVSEGIANVVLEAMAAGLPVVSTDCGGMQEVVKPAETGILVKRRDARSIAAGLLEYQAMPEAAVTTLRANAFELVRTNFSQQQQLKNFVSLYQSLS